MERSKEIPFAGSSASSSEQPRWDLLPRNALLKLIRRCELGIERKTLCSKCGISKQSSQASAVCSFNHEGTHEWVCKAWNARSDNQSCLQDREFVISRIVHTINHAYDMLDKILGNKPDDGDDDAAAIMWNGMFLCAAVDVMKHHEWCESTSIDTDSPGIGIRCGAFLLGDVRCDLLHGHAGKHVHSETHPVTHRP